MTCVILELKSQEEKEIEYEQQKKILWKIFISTLYLSAFTFGGATNQTEGVYPY